MQCTNLLMSYSWYVWPRVCLYDTVCEHGQELEGLDEPLGRRYNVDEQCKFYTGQQDAKSCVSIIMNVVKRKKCACVLFYIFTYLNQTLHAIYMSIDTYNIVTY